MDLPELIPNLRKRGSEFVGPCPYCGEGDDRFLVTPDATQDGRALFWCRRCATGGDAITYLRDHRGATYPEACDVLGVEPEDAPARYADFIESIEEKREEARYQHLLDLVLLKQYMTGIEDELARQYGRVHGTVTKEKIEAADRFLEMHLEQVKARLKQEGINWQTNGRSEV